MLFFRSDLSLNNISLLGDFLKSKEVHLNFFFTFTFSSRPESQKLPLDKNATNYFM